MMLNSNLYKFLKKNTVKGSYTSLPGKYGVTFYQSNKKKIVLTLFSLTLLNFSDSLLDKGENCSSHALYDVAC